MKCTNCGYDNTEDTIFCLCCGSVLTADQDSVNTRMLSLLGDGSFLALCVLYSAGYGFTLLYRDFSVIKTLMTIFLWLVFAQGKKGNVSVKHMRCVSGVLFASYLVNLIVFILLGIFSLCCFLAGIFSSTGNGESRLGDILYDSIEPYLGGYIGSFPFDASFFLIMFSSILMIAVVVGILFNEFGWHSIHKFAQSLYKSVQCGKFNIVKYSQAKTWLMVFGVMSALSALGSGSFLTNGCEAAVDIIGSILIGKYFKEV